MKMIDHIRRKPAFIAFGRSSAESGFVNVELAATRTANSVTVTAADGSAAPIAAADATKAGVLTAADKTKLDGLTVGGGQTPPTDFAHRGLVTVATIDPGVDRLRTAGYSATGDGGGALYRRVASEPSHALKIQSADGAWWELVPDPAGVSILQAGGKADSGTTDNAVAFMAILNFARLNPNIYYSGSLPILYPAADGAYHHASTLSLKHACVIRGGGGCGLNNRATILTWPAMTDGIVFEYINTEHGNPSAPTTTGASNSIIEGLNMVGGGTGGGTQATLHHGITMHTPSVLVRDVGLTNWPGDGIHIVGDVTVAAGNANLCRLSGVESTANRRFGLYLQGGDANAFTIDSLNASSNGGAGVYDDSFLGGTIVGGHMASNFSRAQVHHGGNRYHVNPLAIVQGLSPSTEQPGTGSAWVLNGAGTADGNFPDWVSGTDYYPGGAILVVNQNARTALFGTYQENDQPAGYMTATAFHCGGIQNPYTGPGAQLEGKYLTGGIAWRNRSDSTSLQFQMRSEADVLMRAVADASDHPSGWSLFWNSNVKAWCWRHANADARDRLLFHSTGSVYDFGRSAPPADGAIQVSDHFFGAGNNARFRGIATAAPTSGDHARGEVVWNRDPSAGGSVGWVCVAAGSPGTWKTFGSIAP